MPTNPSDYGVGQACLNGHKIAGDVRGMPQHAEAFCSECGVKTITECPGCGASIRGYYHSPGVLIAGWSLGRHCYKCGEPYPWIAEGLSAARELASFAEGLNDEERALLAASFDDLVRDTPRTPVAIARAKVLISKMAGPTASAIRDILEIGDSP